MHYKRWWRNGDPVGLRNFSGVPIGERILASVCKNDDGCWVWTGPKVRRGGYGALAVKGRTAVAHRLAYEEFVGPIPEGLQLDHLCRVTLCCNPEHLEPVTPRENSLRSESLPAINARKTHCIHGHEFNTENTYWRRDRPGCRQCKACERERRQS